MTAEASVPRGAPRWPASFALLGFVVAIVSASSLGVVAATAADALGGGASPLARVLATLLQDLAFIGTALVLARTMDRVSLADFGLRRLPLRALLGSTLLAAAVFYGVLALYSALVRPEGRQDVLPTLGVQQGTAWMIAGAVLVVVLAPIAEELLFRGFLYRCLRNRLGALTSTAIIATVFGSLHYSGPETLALLPPLVLLGALFCVLYERTGSLYPAILLHAINNAIAFGATAGVDGAGWAALGGLLVVTGLCTVRPAARAGAPG